MARLRRLAMLEDKEQGELLVQLSKGAYPAPGTAKQLKLSSRSTDPYVNDATCAGYVPAMRAATKPVLMYAQRVAERHVAERMMHLRDARHQAMI